MTARQMPDGAWRLVHPRCALERADDLAEVQGMLAAGETEIATDELRWLLADCSDCIAAHRLLGEIALGDEDFPLARGHFGYAFKLGMDALRRAEVIGPAPYCLPDNQPFLESGKGLAHCLLKLDKRDLAAEVIGDLLSADPADPLGVRGMLGA